MPFPIATAGSGMTIGFPDACKQPAGTAIIVVPYANNMTHNAMIQLSVAFKVRIANLPVATAMTQTINTLGDSLGIGGGAISGVFMGQGAFRSFAVKVKAQGSPVILHMVSSAGLNGPNANVPCGMQCTPSQVKVMGT